MRRARVLTHANLKVAFKFQIKSLINYPRLARLSVRVIVDKLGTVEKKDLNSTSPARECITFKEDKLTYVLYTKHTHTHTGRYTRAQEGRMYPCAWIFITLNPQSCD